MLRQELKKMSRSELLELLIDQTNENERLRKQLMEAQSQLVNRMLVCENTGSLAEAVLTLNGVFEAAQAACDQYTENIKMKSAHIEDICEKREKETEEKCAKMVAEAEAAAKAHWEKVSEKIEAMMNQSAMLRGLLSEMLSDDKD